MNFRLLLSTLLIGLLTGFAGAQAQSDFPSEPPQGGEPKPFTVPDTQTLTLDNGMRVTTAPYGNLPKVTVQLIVETGSVHESDEQHGITELLADLLQQGTADMDAKALSKEMANMGGELSINVGTNQTYIRGSVLSEFAPDLIRLMANVIQEPALPESELERIKNNLNRSIAVQQSRPQVQASLAFNNVIYGDHPYGRSLPNSERVEDYSIEDVKAFFEKHYGAQRSHLYVSGVYDEAAVTNTARLAFQDWAEGPQRHIPKPDPQSKRETVVIDRPGAPQSTIVMGLPVPDPSNEDYLTLSVMNTLLGGSFSSRITSNIREDKGYTYSPRSVVDTEYRAATWYEQADVTSNVTGESIHEILKEIKRLRDEAPGEQELEGIKNYSAGIFVLQNSTPSGIIGQLNFLELHDLDRSFLTERVQRIYEMQPEDIRNVAAEYLTIDDMTLVIVGDKDQLQNTINRYEQELN
ncbi:MAG: M16 family metallopeptidase [Bacteroidota bacterium]